MGRVKRQIKFYGVWGRYGDPVPSVELGITVEVVGGVNVAVMVFDEDDKRLHENWDTGFSEKSDMRVYPLPVSGSGGTITLLNSGWYSTFVSSGYSFNGCRVSRGWEGDTNIDLGNYIVKGVLQSIGEVSITLGTISDSLVADVTTAPLVVGTWEGVKLEAEEGGEQKLFDGMTFYAPRGNISRGNDSFTRPLYYTAQVVPSGVFQPTELVFPTNSYCRVVAGYNKGTVFSVPKGTVLRGSTDGKFYFQVRYDVTFGVAIDDENEVGLIDGVPEEGSITDMSIFEFFVSNIVFKTGEGTVLTNAVDEDGKSVFVSSTESGYTLQLSSKKWDAIETNTPVMGGTNVLSQIDTNLNWSFYNEETGIYADSEAQQATVTTGSITDGDRNTFTMIESDNRFSAQWYIDNPPTDIKGVLADLIATYDGMESVYFDRLKAIQVHVVAEWASTGEYEGVENIELLLSSGWSFGYIDEVEGKYAEYSNFSQDYYIEEYEIARCSQLDERTFIGGSGIPEWSPTSDSHYLGGVNRLGIENTDPLESRPRRLYIIITPSDLANSSKPNQLRINELGVRGDVTEIPTSDSVIYGDISGLSGDWETMSGAITNIASQQNFSLFNSVSVSVEESAVPVKAYITTQSDLLTSNALKTILREAWYLGGMSRDGTTWRANSIAGMIGKDVVVEDSHYFRVPRTGLATKAISYDSDNVPNSGTINYGVGGAFAGNSITISNVDQDSYLESYVQGISNPQSAESLWNMAHLIWLKTKTVVDIRSDISKLRWIYKEEDAINYLTNLFNWNGGDGFSRNVFTASFDVANIDENSNFWNIGDACRVYIPTITNTGDYSGVVTGVDYKASDYSATITCRVGQINQEIVTIKEVGITGGEVPVITETGITAGTDLTITEIGVQ